MGLPAIGAVVKDVLISRSPDGDDLILFEDGSQVAVRKTQEASKVQEDDYGMNMQRRGSKFWVHIPDTGV